MRVSFILLIMLTMFSRSAWALDPSSAQAYCDDVKKAAQNAQTKYIQIYQPRVDPGKTFDDATSSCLGFISNFNVSIPTMWDGILGNMATQLMQRACQAAQQQFNKAVNDATQSVNGTVNQVPGANVGVQTGTGNYGVSVSGDNGSTMQNTATTAVDRVINFLK